MLESLDAYWDEESCRFIGDDLNGFLVWYGGGRDSCSRSKGLGEIFTHSLWNAVCDGGLSRLSSLCMVLEKMRIVDLLGIISTVERCLLGYGK